VRTTRPLTAVIWLSTIALAACGSEAPKEAGQGIALCQEAMKIHSARMHDDEHKTEKLQHGCKQSANMKTPAQWQCVLDGLNKGGDYIPVSSKCFGLK
jgi:hypothetical protein